MLGLVISVKPSPEVKIIEKPVIVKEIQIEKVPAPVVVKEIQIEKVPTPVVVKEVQIEKVPTPVVVEKVIERVVEKPVKVESPAGENLPRMRSVDCESSRHPCDSRQDCSSVSRGDGPTFRRCYRVLAPPPGPYPRFYRTDLF